MDDSVVNDLLKFFGFFILVLGGTGNALSLVVLCRKPLRTSKIGPYLIALCIADISELLVVTIYELFVLYELNVEHRSVSLCKMTYFVRGLASQCPSWLTVIITVERTFCISRPLSSLQRTPNPLAVVCTMLLVLIALNIAIVVIVFEIIGGHCTFNTKHHIWFVAATYTLIPSLVLIVCNSVIIYKMCNRPALGETSRSRPHAGRNVIKLVLAINSVFLVTTLPIALQISICQSLAGKNIILADLISSLNNAGNFVLYFLFSSVFRRELRFLFRDRPQPQVYALSDHENL